MSAKNNKKSKAGKQQQRQPGILVYNPHRNLGTGDQIVKRMTLANLTVSTNGSGYLPATVLITNDMVRSNPAAEWASFAARYQEFRVRRMTVRLTPNFTVNTTAPLTLTQVYMSDFSGTSAPATSSQVFSDEGGVVFSSKDEVAYMTDWSKFPNAKLWSSVGTPIPGLSIYGIAIASNINDTTAASNVLYGMAIEWEVELKGSQ